MSYSLPTGLGGPFTDENSQKLLYKIAAYLGASLSGSAPLTVTGSFTPPAGVATEAEQQAQTTQLTSIRTAVSTAPTLSAANKGLTRFRSATLSNTAVSVKASAGAVYSIRVQSPAANVLPTYIKFFNVAAASVTPGTTVPILVLEVPAYSAPNTGQLIIVPGAYPIEFFATAVSVLATSVLSDSGTQTAPTAAVLLEAGYA
jgi:hypothetical protein